MKYYGISAIFIGFLLFEAEWKILQVNPKEKSKSYHIMTGNDVIEKIKSNITCTWREKTVDTFKSGNPDDEVTGVVVTFMATMDVLEKAKSLGYNLIITHEPTYYNHLDNNPKIEDTQVLIDKKKFIDDNDLMVFRFHDHWHCTQPDGIYKGMNRFFGWEEYLVDGTDRYFEIPPTTLQQLSESLTEKFENITIRVVGDPELEVTKVATILGAPGSLPQIKMLHEDRVQVLIAGETNEWETVEYARDAAAQGKQKALILLGHLNSEEEGMRYCAAWLQTFINDVPVKFVPAGDPFWTVKKTDD